jgi:hypothetical protein
VVAQNSESGRENPEEGTRKGAGTSVLLSAAGGGEEGTGKNEPGELSTADLVGCRLGK